MSPDDESWLNAWLLSPEELEDWYRDLPIELSDEGDPEVMTLSEAVQVYGGGPSGYWSNGLEGG